jgi:replication-associated recombination protein RarA
MNPANYRPVKIEDFIGSARREGEILLAKFKREREGGGPFRILLQGAPGTGKSRLAQVLARDLAGHELGIEEVNGKMVGIDVVRDWMQRAPYRSLFGDYQVKLINEIDLCTADAMNLLLTYVDQLPPFRAVIATCNPPLEMFAERFQSRFQYRKIKNCTTSEVSEWLVSKWKMPQPVATAIAVQSGGNVRLAMNDAQDWWDTKLASAA